MACRLPTIERYRRERLAQKQKDEAAREVFTQDLSERVSEMRVRHLEGLCRIAEFVNDSADETHRYLTDRREARIEHRDTMRQELHEHRASIRADMERIVGSDFHL